MVKATEEKIIAEVLDSVIPATSTTLAANLKLIQTTTKNIE
jgi:hypothetical protein